MVINNLNDKTNMCYFYRFVFGGITIDRFLFATFAQYESAHNYLLFLKSEESNYNIVASSKLLSTIEFIDIVLGDYAKKIGLKY